jgi:hypothetical protein
MNGRDPEQGVAQRYAGMGQPAGIDDRDAEVALVQPVGSCAPFRIGRSDDERESANARPGGSSSDSGRIARVRQG